MCSQVRDGASAKEGELYIQVSTLGFSQVSQGDGDLNVGSEPESVYHLQDLLSFYFFSLGVFQVPCSFPNPLDIEE